MCGLESTRKLKIDHPGLGTTATRSAARLTIQNDIGETDAPKGVVCVDAANCSTDFSCLGAGASTECCSCIGVCCDTDDQCGSGMACLRNRCVDPATIEI